MNDLCVIFLSNNILWLINSLIFEMNHKIISLYQLFTKAFVGFMGIYSFIFLHFSLPSSQYITNMPPLVRPNIYYSSFRYSFFSLFMYNISAGSADSKYIFSKINLSASCHVLFHNLYSQSTCHYAAQVIII